MNHEGAGMTEVKSSRKQSLKNKKTKEVSDSNNQIAEAEKPKSLDIEPIAPVAKAGKRSARAIAKTEEMQAKEERKSSTKAKEEKPKIVQKPPRNRTERAGKKFREAFGQIDRTKPYNLAEALDLAVKTSTTKFDSTVELHLNLDVDPKQADQNVRDTVPLPNGTGKPSRVAVFAEGDDALKARKAGADEAGSDELLAELEKGRINFDILISTPSLMARLGKYAKLLGPKGLMPNPKSGTVTADIVKAVKEAKAGRVEFRVDQAGIIHLGIGKVSFGPQKLLQNAEAVLSSVRAAKPASVKGIYIKTAYVTTTMGPSIKITL